MRSKLLVTKFYLVEGDLNQDKIEDMIPNGEPVRIGVTRRDHLPSSHPYSLTGASDA